MTKRRRIEESETIFDFEMWDEWEKKRGNGGSEKWKPYREERAWRRTCLAFGFTWNLEFFFLNFPFFGLMSFFLSPLSLSSGRRREELSWQFGKAKKCLRTALSFSLPESDSERFVFAEYGKRIKVEFISYGLEDINGPWLDFKRILRHELNLPKFNLLDSWPLAFKSVVQTGEWAPGP